MKLEVYTTNVELQDIPSYTTSITLEGQLLRLSFLWNERIGKRTLSIKNSSDECYLQNTILHPNEPLELNSNAVLDDLSYSVTLVKTGDVNKVGNIFNWSKDFILCFSRTVDLDVKRLNVVYGVTTPSTPILPPPTPAFGVWTLNQGFTILGDDIRYTGYKTNNIDTYDSFALSSLQSALVKSFLDPDLQQYTAFTTAVEQLIGSVNWVLDPDNNQIVYYEEVDLNCAYLSYVPNVGRSNSLACGITASMNKALIEYNARSGISGITSYSLISCSPSSARPESGTCSLSVTYLNSGAVTTTTWNVSSSENPDYDPNATGEEKSIPLTTVAQQVISNAASSTDEVLKLLSEDYINLVANSVFDSNPIKRFVKLEDLTPQLEANKVLR